MQARARRRLPPAERTEQILDAAARLVLRDGATHLNMQMVAVEAGVSKGLMYAYFPNITSVLQQVYARENKKLHRQHIRSLRNVRDPADASNVDVFEQMVRTTDRISRAAQADRRLLVERLASNPEIKAALAVEDERNRQQVIDFLSAEIAASFSLPRLLARQATALALRYDDEAAELAAQPGAVVPQDEIWGAMIVGAMRELAERFGGADITDDTLEISDD